jgi:hypothetical protein
MSKMITPSDYNEAEKFPFLGEIEAITLCGTMPHSHG